MDNSRVAQWKRAGPITQRSVDRNYALLQFLFFFFFPFARKRYPTNFKVPLSCFDVFSSLWLRRGVYCHSHTFIEVNKEEEKHKSSHLTVLKGSFFSQRPPDKKVQQLCRRRLCILIGVLWPSNKNSPKRRERTLRLRLYVTRLSLLDKDVKSRRQ